MVILNNMGIVSVLKDLLVSHKYLAGPLMKGVISSALARVMSHIILQMKPLISNAGLKLIPDFRHLRRKRCHGELMGKKFTGKTSLSSEVRSGLIQTFLLPLFSTGRLYIDLSFYSLFK